MIQCLVYVIHALVAGIRETHLSSNLLHPRMFYHRFKNGCNANFMIFYNISQLVRRAHTLPCEGGRSRVRALLVLWGLIYNNSYPKELRKAYTHEISTNFPNLVDGRSNKPSMVIQAKKCFIINILL